MKKLSFILLVLMVLSSGSVYSEKGSYQRWKNEDHADNFKPYSELSVGMSMRLDERYALSHSPTIRARLYTNITRVFSTKLGIGYNNSTKTKRSYYYNNVDISDLIFEGGFRIKESAGKIYPYFEMGFESHNYYMQLGGTGNVSKTGFNGALGIIIDFNKRSSLDISLRHTINHVNTYIYVDYMPLPPEPQWYPIGYHYNLDNSFFNPTSIQLMYNFRL